MLELILLTILSYLLGSIPTGILIAMLMGGPDPRSAGSGNIGATNVMRVTGLLAGALTLSGDVLKGAIPVFIGQYIFGSISGVSLLALASFLGHLFPVFLGFKGGKGVATASGIFLVISPLVVLIDGIIFGLVVYISRYVSLGSLTAAALLPILITSFLATRGYLPLAIVIGILVIIKHTDNIKRLIQGKENRIGGKSPRSPL